MWNRRAVRVILLTVMLFTAFFPALLFPVRADASWYNDSWAYRKSLAVLHAAGSGTNYQVKIIVKNSSSADSGNTVNIDASNSGSSKLRSDFGDVRFTASDGTTLLYAWNETFYSGKNVTVWVKVTDSLSTVDTTIYLYYGNSGATKYWDGPNTFLFFDDFLGAVLNHTQWKSWGGTSTVGVSASILTYSSSTNYDWSQGYIDNLTGIQYGRWESNSSITSGSSAYEMLGLESAYDPNSATNNMSVFYSSATSPTLYVRNLSSTATPASNYAISGTTYTIKSILWNSTQVQFWENQTNSVSNGNITTAVPKNTYMNCSFQCYGASGTIYMDWVFLSKYVYPEPGYGSWGVESAQGPKYDLAKVGTNSTDSVASWLFYSYWWTVLGTLSGYIFSFNASTAFVNDTWVTFPDTNSTWANVTSHTISNTAGTIISWQISANDSYNHWIILPLQYVTVSATILLYLRGSGTIERNGTLLANGTSTTYNQLNIGLELAALPSAGYAFVNFTCSYTSSTTNPFNFSVVNSTTIWFYCLNLSTPWIQASFTWSPSNPAISAWVTFDASASSSSGAIANYTWNYGDSSSWNTGVTSATQHFYSVNATFQVSLIVGGDLGNSSTLVLAIVVGWGANHTEPSSSYAIARFDFTPNNPILNHAITFNSSQSYTTSTITQYGWSWNDSSSDLTSATTISHAFTSAGLYNVTLNVTDSGATLSSFTFHLVNVTIDLYASGYSAGWIVGNASGYSDGYSAGYAVGWNVGNASGWNAGNTSGWNAGNSSGWASGNATGWASGNATGWVAGNASGYVNGYSVGWIVGNNTGYLAGLAAGGGVAPGGGGSLGWGALLLIILIPSIIVVLVLIRRRR